MGYRGKTHKTGTFPHFPAGFLRDKTGEEERRPGENEKIPPHCIKTSGRVGGIWRK